MGRQCTVAADVYSFGILLGELASLQVERKRREWVVPCAPRDCPQGVVDLVQDCLAADPLQRPTIAQVLLRLQQGV